tara:strand:- start:15987 stop:16511 length:525 start_codon:yes stop_codon:yes gene_type:complete
MIFLLGAGNLTEAEILPGSIAISSFFELPLIKISTEQTPVSVFNSLPNQNGISQLIGDPAITFSDGSSWMEALGAWRKPIVLLVKSLPSGEVPGQAPAYFALARSLSVPVIGLVQLGGIWEPKKRSLDGLPWCGGLLDEKVQSNNESKNINSSYSMDIVEVGANLRKRIIQMGI